MPDTPQASGADLARQALAAYKATARTAPPAGPKKTRHTSRPARGRLGDPQGLGQVLEKLTNEQGWEAALGGGSLIDQWPQICPAELATTVQPVAYDPERGILELRPSSPAYATQIRLFQQQLAKHLNTKLGQPAVRSIRVLAPGGGIAPVSVPHPEPSQPEPAPVKTRETASAGYRATLEAALAHRRPHQPTDPYTLAAMARQEAAARANRLPEPAAELDQATPQVDRSEVARRAALARKRQEAAGMAEPRRAFDVA